MKGQRYKLGHAIAWAGPPARAAAQVGKYAAATASAPLPGAGEALEITLVADFAALENDRENGCPSTSGVL
jgi:hypothetical protein